MPGPMIVSMTAEDAEAVAERHEEQEARAHHGEQKAWPGEFARVNAAFECPRASFFRSSWARVRHFAARVCRIVTAHSSVT